MLKPEIDFCLEKKNARRTEELDLELTFFPGLKVPVRAVVQLIAIPHENLFTL